jgi:hypothetical protein
VRIEASYAPFRVIPAIELRTLDTYLILQRPIVPSARHTRCNAPSPKPRAPRHLIRVLETYCVVDVGASTITVRIEVATFPALSAAT